MNEFYVPLERALRNKRDVDAFLESRRLLKSILKLIIGERDLLRRRSGMLEMSEICDELSLLFLSRVDDIKNVRI